MELQLLIHVACTQVPVHECSFFSSFICRLSCQPVSGYVEGCTTRGHFPSHPRGEKKKSLGSVHYSDAFMREENERGIHICEFGSKQGRGRAMKWDGW